MTTEAREHDERPRPSAAARLGAIAGVTPVVTFLAWTAVSGWGGTPIEFVQASAIITAVALVAGWIVGARSGPSIRSALVGIFAYPFVAWQIVLPIGVIVGTWNGLQDRALVDPAAVADSVVGLLLYGLVAFIYVFVYLTPFGAGWAFTYYLLRRGMRV